ncbi:hypothetical protein [Brevundimonas sp. R86498]|uniref:hypothetical protein n=1 Tax=Brevundimonas sp. R86498 TaxID=3093845 RepID=UPI0037C8263B
MTAVQTYRVRLAGAALLAAVGLVAAVAVALPLSLPTDHAGPVPLAAVSEARALQAASATPPRLEESAAWSRRTLAVRPGDATAWARLAWVAAEQGNNADMVEALDRSFAVAPFGPEITGWRLRFIYERWSLMTPDLRRQALAELAVTVRTRPRVARAALAEIADPAGRLAFLMVQAQVRLEEQRKREALQASSPVA